MKVLKLIFKNSLRHKLRTALTILGIAIAVLAFGILRTVVTSWDEAVKASSPNRLITRQSVSFIFPLPYAYKDKIANVEGVKSVTFAAWFQGVYKDKNQFFARMAVDHETFMETYDEMIVPKIQIEAFKRERSACIIGNELAKMYGLKLGDVMTLEGDIYPGRWDFVIRGIYTSKFKYFDPTQMFFRWDYIDERLKEETPERAGWVGWYIIRINDPDKTAVVSYNIDILFKNSPAETKTESERAFTENFMVSIKALFTAMNFMSFAIVGIIMLVLGNTMIMSARERTREYAVFKTLGFSTFHMVGLIMGESLLISILGGGVGLAITFPMIAGFEQVIPKNYFPSFELQSITVMLSIIAALLVGIVSAVFPIQRVIGTKIVEGFRFVG
ncbi:MAG: FtsX-like permease family protein [Ignavibacteria bacterium]|nr:FtsX-like permease family protein [Ignavibacteria bacterium]